MASAPARNATDGSEPEWQLAHEVSKMGLAFVTKAVRAAFSSGVTLVVPEPSSMRPLQPMRASAARAPADRRTMGRCRSRVSNMARRDFSDVLEGRPPSMGPILQHVSYHCAEAVHQF